MILHSLVEIALVLPLIGAVAVDQREIALVIPAGIKEARAGLDGSVAGSPYANLAVVRCCRNNKPSGSHADQASENPSLNVFCEQHQTPRCLVRACLTVALDSFSSYSYAVAPGKEHNRS